MAIRPLVCALFLVILFAACAHRQAARQDSAVLPRLMPLPGTGTLPPAKDPERFGFVVFGDAMETQQPSATIRTIFGNIRQMRPRPAFALSLGDIIEGEPTEPIDAPEIARNLETFLGVARTGGVPVFNAPGNHELDDVSDVPSARMLRIYEQVVGPAYGFFDYGNSHFIALNTSEVPPPGNKAPPKSAPTELEPEFSYVSPLQIAQLTADLEANRHKTHIFVAMHYPLKPLAADDRLYPESTARQLIELFAKYPNVSYVLAAHEHLYYNAQSPINLTDVPPYAAGQPERYLVSGGGGARIWVKPEEGGFHHYLIFQVDGPRVSVTLKRLP